jgi:hypothetical protein
LARLDQLLSKDMPLVLTGVSFVAFPIAISEFKQIETNRQLIFLCIASSFWMITVLIGIRSIPDVLAEELDVRLIRIKRRGLLQLSLLAIGGALFYLALIGA